MKRNCKLICFIIAVVIAAAGIVPAAAYSGKAEGFIEGIIEYNLQESSSDTVQEWINGELSDCAGIGSEWYIISLSNYGDYDFSEYRNALNVYLSENEVGSASSRLKYALAFIAADDKTNPYINTVINDSIGEQGIMSLVFGLHILNNGFESDLYPASEIVDELLSLQLDDGGWSIMGEYGDVDVTAMTIQALAAYYDNNPSVKSAVDKAVEFLSVRQLESGEYSAYGVINPESTAQVVIALSVLGIDAASDGRFIKNGNTVFDAMEKFCLSDGSFCHKEGGNSDSTATSQVLNASVAYENMKKGKKLFYVFNEKNNKSEETVSDIAETSVSAEATIYIENTSELTTAETIADPQTTKTEKNEEIKHDSFHGIIVFACAALSVICVLIVVKRKSAH